MDAAMCVSLRRVLGSLQDLTPELQTERQRLILRSAIIELSDVLRACGTGNTTAKTVALLLGLPESYHSIVQKEGLIPSKIPIFTRLSDVPQPHDITRVIVVVMSPNTRWYASISSTWREIVKLMPHATILPVAMRSVGVVNTMEDVQSVTEAEAPGISGWFKPPLSFIVWDGRANAQAEEKYNTPARRAIMRFVA